MKWLKIGLAFVIIVIIAIVVIFPASINSSGRGRWS